MRTTLISAILLILLISCQSKKQPIGIAELKEIIKKRELHLVEYKYNDHIFLHKKDNLNKKIHFIVKTPVSVSAAINLQEMEIDTVERIIYLPFPTIVDTIINFGKVTEIIKVNDGLTLSNGRKNILSTLIKRMEECKHRIAQNAIDIGILEQAQAEAEDFISDLLLAFNLEEASYEVSFLSEEQAKTDNPFFEASKSIVELELDFMEIEDTD
ncbi:MAG: DUF4230 domain-containing protein [Bacteroidota bacterium]